MSDTELDLQLHPSFGGFQERVLGKLKKNKNNKIINKSLIFVGASFFGVFPKISKFPSKSNGRHNPGLVFLSLSLSQR